MSHAIRTLIVLRHSLTRKNLPPTWTGSHLSPEGVRLAREVGATLPRIDHVAVGDQPRHFETALALGVAVDEQVSWPSGYVAGEVDHHDQWRWPRPFERYADLVTGDTGLAEVACVHLRDWRRIIECLPEGGTALVVSSGGSIEPVLVAALPHADHSEWGSALHQLEGATITWAGPSAQSIEIRRTGRH